MVVRIFLRTRLLSSIMLPRHFKVGPLDEASSWRPPLAFNLKISNTRGAVNSSWGLKFHFI
jgi:hypothetical protein